MKKIVLALSLLPLGIMANENDEKLADDPTRVVTSLGINYSSDFSSDNLKFNGSLALDEIRKINVSVNQDASEWRVGGSWLFDLGIVNFNFGKNEYEHDATQTNYSVGTFVPLSVFDIEPFAIQLFPMAGYTYNDGEVACDASVDLSCKEQHAELSNDYVLVPSSSHSGYVGLFALKPLTQQLTAIGFTGVSIGSNDYFGYWFGGGTSYSLKSNQSVSLTAYLFDNPYGSETRVSASYSYTF